LWPCWSWEAKRELWSGKYKTTGHGSLIITNLAGRIAFVSEPVTGNRHDMTKLKGSECETILKAAGGVFGDKGFIGTDYITTPIRKPEGRELYMREHDYNNQISSFRAPVERAVATLKTWRILFTDYRRPLETFLSSFRAAIGLYFFKETCAYPSVSPIAAAGLRPKPGGGWWIIIRQPKIRTRYSSPHPCHRGVQGRRLEIRAPQPVARGIRAA
jgi:hypothetical protein